jgi:hypothetical protein
MIPTVGDLVCNNTAHCAVIDGVVRAGVEKGELEDRGGEDDLVQLGGICSKRTPKSVYNSNVVE